MFCSPCDKEMILPSSLFLFSPLDRGIPRIPFMEYDPAGSLEALVTGGEAVLGTRKTMEFFF